MLIAFYILVFGFHHYNFLINSNILQKQYYEINRYIIYLKQNCILFIVKLIFVLLSLSLSIISKWFCCFYLLSFVQSYKNNIIKFKITNRIKRLFVIFEIINISILIFQLTHINHFYLNMILSLLTYWLAFTFSVLLEKLILFKNIKKAQQKIKQYKTKIIGISGSYGKTSCKNYLYELLVNKYNVLITKSSFNTLNGILITINNYLMPYHDYIILEVGVDKKNGMNKFIKYFNFDITLLTCIGYQHLKTFKNIDNIAKEKLKLLKSCKDICIINEDDKYIKNVDVNCNTIHCSTLVDSDIKITKLSKSKIQIKIYQNIYECNCNLLGSHNLSNLCLCVGVAKALEIDDNKIINQIQKLKNPTHRLSINKFNKWTILDDSYNSNIDGFNSAVQEVSYYNNFKVLITPGIIEKNEMLNNRICNLIDKVNATFDLILLTSNNKDFNNVKNKIVFNSFKDAYNYLQEKYKNEELLVLIENDVPDIFLR